MRALAEWGCTLLHRSCTTRDPTGSSMNVHAPVWNYGMLDRAGEKYLQAFEAMSGLVREGGDGASPRMHMSTAAPINNSGMNYRQQCWLLHHRLKAMPRRDCLIVAIGSDFFSNTVEQVNICNLYAHTNMHKQSGTQSRLSFAM